MLQNCEYVAAIIPESFITSNLFHRRLEVVVSLTCKMFDDTDCPVCLALFSPDNGSDDFKVFRQDKFINYYSELKKCLFVGTQKNNSWKINDPEGNIGIKCVDNQIERSIKFVNGSSIPSGDIKVTSRAYTRVSGLPEEIDLEIFLHKCNQKLNLYRDLTSDVFLTSFKGLRKDGYYRRRLDFATAKDIMTTVLEEMQFGTEE